MKFNNFQIFNLAQNLLQNYNQENLYIPIKANFLINKNIKLLSEMAEEIEKARYEIIQHYGILQEDKQQYNIPEEKIIEANQEIADLFSIEQELNIQTIKLEDLGDIKLTTKQMQAIMFMIEE